MQRTSIFQAGKFSMFIAQNCDISSRYQPLMLFSFGMEEWSPDV